MRNRFSCYYCFWMNKIFFISLQLLLYVEKITISMTPLTDHFFTGQFGVCSSSADFASFRTKPFSCDKCSKSYINRGHLRRHLVYECGKQPQFQCPICAHRCKLKENMKKHIVIKHDGRKYACPNNCGKMYSYKKGLNQHLKYECGLNPNFQCNFCHFRSKFKFNLTKHIAVKHGPKFDMIFV
ncbi:zinc finger protein 425-like [Nilaparvata lugens]|uniref:zinc finger protein 425-like n=1 Tax=Nilaparvata lugens TaxID=108931 RepID=UPI00193E76AB|nr:zinc finger protein 425-like [Nilaparvata lugens]